MRMIVTRPEHDLTTRYIAHWAEAVIVEARAKQIDVVDLQRNAANRREFEGRARKLRPEFIFLNGHGADDRVCGHDNESLVDGRNEALLDGTVTYAVSCSSAKILGRSATRDNRSSYIGYEDEFVFPCDPSCTTRPLNDQRAKPFMEFSNAIPRTLLKGGTCADAVQRAKRVAGRFIRLMLSSAAGVGALQHAKYMSWDAGILSCHGDQQQSL